MSPTIGVMGLGRWGLTLYTGLLHLGYQVRGLRRESQDGKPAVLDGWVHDCRVLCLAVRDDQLNSVVDSLKEYPLEGKTVLFHSGLKPLAILDPLAERGALVGKLHPLYSFSQVVEQPMPAGIPFAVAGNERVTRLLGSWISRWKGEIHHLTEADWTRYHLAAVAAANFLPLFIRWGAEILKPLEPESDKALAWLAPLVRQSVEGALSAENLLAFSGPAIRGDHETMRAHEKFLEMYGPQWQALYKEASKCVGAQRKGGDDHLLDEN